MKIGQVKFFNTERGFGFVNSEQTDYFLHFSKLNKSSIKEGDYVLFEYRESRKNAGKYEIINLELITKENSLLLLSKVENKYKKILYKLFPILLDKLANEEVDKLTEDIHNEVESKVNGFNLLEFIDKISTRIATGKTKKPGDDDSFWALIVSDFPKTEDAYLNSLNPRYCEETYRDRGFYSCYSMEDDYNRAYRAGDEERLPEIQFLLKETFKNKYKSNEHYSFLLDDIKKQHLTKIKKTILEE
ncbi:cold-shock protein [Rufibacter quisquiliarum]|uniref:Cold shock CspA family protein n=1 Tax=Rufibacter quisquiliarum TaxID=1549639 RepID=A0A839GJU3_9BACT|nr:cold shock domain-containing protein [Rufibacter quisquiliarum]MBA9079864.1 cold shock CspA family protein [Rufibacter quisquiliarum]